MVRVVIPSRSLYRVGTSGGVRSVAAATVRGQRAQRHMLLMGHPRNPTAYYLASTLLAYRRLRPKSVHTCSCRCEHKGFAVSTQLLRLHLPVKCEQRILNSVLLERYRCRNTALTALTAVVPTRIFKAGLREPADVAGVPNLFARYTRSSWHSGLHALVWVSCVGR